MKNRFFTFDDQGMAGIVATLKTGYHNRLISQQIDNLAFAFIAPLGAQHHDILSHVYI